MNGMSAWTCMFPPLRDSPRSRTDAHADASTFVPRKAATDGFATGPTRSPFADALKADRNHGSIRAIPFMTYKNFI